MSGESKIRDTAEVVKGLVEAVPVYQDLAQPMAQELSKSLVIVAKAVRVALAPVSAFVWGYEKISDYLAEKLTEELRGIPPERIITPEADVAVPAIEALRYSRLREQYASLLATAMDSQTAHEAHPAFVEILKQLKPDEARLLGFLSKRFREIYWYLRAKDTDEAVDLSSYQQTFPLVSGGIGQEDTANVHYFTHFSLLGDEASCSYPDAVPVYIVNLCRLGLTEIFPVEGFHQLYMPLEERCKQFALQQWGIDAETIDFFSIQREGLRLSVLGIQFCAACMGKPERI
jgi:hypothetical protein